MLMVEQESGPNGLKLNIRQDFGNEYASKIYREQRVDVMLYAKAEPSKKLLLKDVLVQPTALTEDILG